jgi:hypothetical protein
MLRQIAIIPTALEEAEQMAVSAVIIRAIQVVAAAVNPYLVVAVEAAVMIIVLPSPHATP